MTVTIYIILHSRDNCIYIIHKRVLAKWFRGLLHTQCTRTSMQNCLLKVCVPETVQRMYRFVPCCFFSSSLFSLYSTCKILLSFKKYKESPTSTEYSTESNSSTISRIQQKNQASYVSPYMPTSKFSRRVTAWKKHKLQTRITGSPRPTDLTCSTLSKRQDLHVFSSRESKTMSMPNNTIEDAFR